MPRVPTYKKEESKPQGGNKKIYVKCNKNKRHCSYSCYIYENESLNCPNCGSLINKLCRIIEEEETD